MCPVTDSLLQDIHIVSVLFKIPVSLMSSIKTEPPYYCYEIIRLVGIQILLYLRTLRKEKPRQEHYKKTLPRL